MMLKEEQNQQLQQSIKPETMENKDTAVQTRKHKKAFARRDIQQLMSIHHFEEIMRLFDENKKRGCDSFGLDQFRDIFTKVFRGALDDDDITHLFMKIDANSDGTVDWDEFSTYMMMGTINSEEKTTVFDDNPVDFVWTQQDLKHVHKDMVIKIQYIPKERKYVSVSRDGTIGIWGFNQSLIKLIETRDMIPGVQPWVSDAAFMIDQLKLILVCDDRKIYIFEILSMKPRLLASIGALEFAPICVSYAGQYDDNNDLLLWGDDAGYVNTILFSKRFFMENVTEEKFATIDLTALKKKENQQRYHMIYKKRALHKDWCFQVEYYPELNSFVSCSADPNRTLAVGDVERRTVRYIHIQKGIKCFDFSRRPSFLVTGGRDKVIRLWNPYVLNKPAGSLTGHNSSISHITIDHELSNIISISEDKMIKIWNARTLQCLQTLQDRGFHRPENIISAVSYDHQNRRLVIGHEKVQGFGLYRKEEESKVTRTHDGPVLAALYNPSFRLIVSGSRDSTIRVWNTISGDKIFQFNNVHDNFDFSTMTYDRIGRRIISGSRDGIIRIWNFNNGQMLQQMFTTLRKEITQLIYVEVGINKYIMSVGWDRRITVFRDEPENFNTQPAREYNGDVGRCHNDDILTVAFQPPGMIATGGVDGIIVIWNLDSGHTKHILKEPFLNLRSPEEKAVEKVIFAPTPAKSPLETFTPLISCHADGFVRIWNPEVGRMLLEINCLTEDSESIDSIVLTPDSNKMILGDTSGKVRIFDITKIHEPTGRLNENSCFQMAIWRAHVSAIVHVDYIDEYKVILTSSIDGSVRAWTITGKYIGSYGANEDWDMEYPESYSPFPNDVQRYNESLQQLRLKNFTQKRQEQIKKDLVRRLKSGPLMITQNMVEIAELELKRILKVNDVRAEVLKTRVLMKAVAAKWLELVNKRRAIKMASGKNSATVAPIQEMEFFRFNSTRKTRSVIKTDVKSESAFHMLQYYPLTTIAPIQKPGAPEKTSKHEGYRRVPLKQQQH